MKNKTLDHNQTRLNLVRAMLPHVPFDGWTWEAMEQGAIDIGFEKKKTSSLRTEIFKNFFKNGSIDFIDIFSEMIDVEVKKEYELKDLTRIQPYINEFVNIYDQVWDKWRNADEPSKNDYIIKAMWVNYQRQHEFNPPHDHSDDLSFVIYLKVPEEIKKEFKEYKGKSSGPGGISFIYGEGNRQAITYQAHFPVEKDLFIFPAWLKHYVAPFKSDVERISVSGNIASNVPFSAIKKKL